MAADPFVLGIAADDPRQFGQPVYAIPDYDQSEMPWYTHQELLALLAPEEDDKVMTEALKHVNDKTLGAEIHHYRCLCKGYEAAEAEVSRRIELQYRIVAEQEKCIQRLQMANAHERLAVQLDPRGFAEGLARMQGKTWIPRSGARSSKREDVTVRSGECHSCGKC